MRARSPNELLNHELAVLILEIKQVLSPHRGKDPVCNAKTCQLSHKRIKVAIGKSGGFVVDGPEGGVGPLLLEFVLHASDHRPGLVSGAELDGSCRQCRRKPSQYDRQNRCSSRHGLLQRLGCTWRL